VGETVHVSDLLGFDLPVGSGRCEVSETDRVIARSRLHAIARLCGERRSQSPEGYQHWCYGPVHVRSPDWLSRCCEMQHGASGSATPCSSAGCESSQLLSHRYYSSMSLGVRGGTWGVMPRR